MPETVCPLNLEDLNGMERFVPAEGIEINEVVALFINAVEFVSGLLHENPLEDMAE